MRTFIWTNMIVSGVVAVSGLILVAAGKFDRDSLAGEVWKIVLALAWSIWAAWLLFT